MTSPRRFIRWWILASVPIPWFGNLILSPVIVWFVQVFGGTNSPFAWWIPFFILQAIITLATAWPQAAVLAKHRRRVRGWVWAALGGLTAGMLVFLSMMSGMNRISPAIALEWSEALNWSMQAVYSTSWTLTAAAAEAFALWGRRWPPAWRFWLAGRVGIGLILWAAAVGVDVAKRSLGGGAMVPYSIPAQLLSSGVHLAAAAASTAWLLDRVVFRTELEAARADPA